MFYSLQKDCNSSVRNSGFSNPPFFHYRKGVEIKIPPAYNRQAGKRVTAGASLQHLSVRCQSCQDKFESLVRSYAP